MDPLWLAMSAALKLPRWRADTSGQEMEAGEQRKQRPGQRVKRVALPSGKTIEVVYFEESGVQAPSPKQGLHVCPDCDSSLVYPVDWSEVNRATWEVLLRCPNCEWTQTGIFEQETVEQFDEELDRGTDSLVD